MDLTKVPVQILSAIGGFVLGGLGIHQWIKNKIAQMIQDKVDTMLKDFKNTKNENLSTSIAYFIRYVGDNFPDIEGNKKLDHVVTLVQNAVPDLVLPDATIRELVQETYDQLKKQLQNN